MTANDLSVGEFDSPQLHQVFLARKAEWWQWVMRAEIDRSPQQSPLGDGFFQAYGLCTFTLEGHSFAGAWS